jgi:putative peptidoglycan lipid II flippase
MNIDEDQPAVEAAEAIDAAGTADKRSADQMVRSSAAVALGTLMSRVTGLLRVTVLAYAIGKGSLADTYNLANSTPNIVYELLLGGVLSATLVPLFVEHLQNDDERATDALITVTMTVLIALTALAVVFAPQIAHLYTFRVDTADRVAQREVATFFIRLFLPQMCFYGFTTLATSALNARRRFAAAAFAPTLNNVVVIAALLLFTKVAAGPQSEWTEVARIHRHTGLMWLLGLGTTAGIAAMAIALMPSLHAADVRLRLAFDWGHAAVKRLVRLSGWTVGYVIANQAALLFVIVLASGRHGAVSAYQYAFIFFQLPHGLFAVSLMTTVTPELARAANRRDFVGMRIQFTTGLRYLVLVVLPASVGYVVLAQPVVGILARGAFSGHDAAVTADTLQALATGLLAFSVYLYTLSGFYAQQDTRTPFLINCFENAVNIVLALLLFPHLGVQGLALAYAGAYGCAAVVALVVLSRRIGRAFDSDTVRVTGRAALATVALAAVAAPVAGVIGSDNAIHAAAAAVLATVAGGTVYLVALRVLGVSEIGTILGILRRRRAPAASDV